MWTPRLLVLLLTACGGGRSGADDANAPATADGCEGDETPTILRYVDEDDDTWGVEDRPIYVCDPKIGATVFPDCDDHDPEVHPEAHEVCHGPDLDCDGLVDEADAGGAFRWYWDEDGDGYGQGTATDGCTLPEGASTWNGDCHDDDPTIHPYAAETCDGIDQDCDNQIDENVPGPTVFCYDADRDGYGDPTQVTTSCVAPSTLYTEDCTDCDDTNGDIHPDATNPDCGGGDGNCDGIVDDAVDADHDGFRACDDCDDLDPAVRPGGADDCGDGIDGDCVGGDALCMPDGPGVFGGTDGADSVTFWPALAVADVDRDGQDDVIAGSNDASLGGTGGGGVFVYLGPLSRDRDAVSPDITWMGAATCTACGSSFLLADLDGDGVDSLLVSDPTADGAGRLRGAVYLLADSTRDTLDTPTLAVLGDDDSDVLGESALATGPDLDADGLPDLLIGSASGGRYGEVIGVSSRATGELAAQDAPLQLSGSSSRLDFGTAVITTDADGDGLSDVVVGAYNDGDGRVYRFLAPLPTAATVDAADGEVYAGAPFGQRLIAGGDLDADGYEDLFTSGYSPLSIGGVWLLRGGEWPADAADLPWRVEGGSGTADWFGFSVAAAGTDQILVGAPGAGTGEVDLYDGPWAGALDRGDAARTLTGMELDMGVALATGDLDADGIVDAACLESRSSADGVVWLWSGARW